MVLQLLALGISDVVNFDFMDKPSNEVCVVLKNDRQCYIVYSTVNCFIFVSTNFSQTARKRPFCQYVNLFVKFLILQEGFSNIRRKGDETEG